MTTRARLAGTICLICMLLVVGHSWSQQRRTIGRVEPGCRLLCLDAEDDGGTVELKAGDYVVVVLMTNPSTGYAWHLEELGEEVLRSLCSGTVQLSPLVGAPADLKWFFEGNEPGETELVLEYYRSWEGPANAIDRFTVNVVVH